MSCKHYTQLSRDEGIIIANRHQNGEDTKIYFAHSYHSWERGRSKNIDGLIREDLPLKVQTSTISYSITRAFRNVGFYEFNNKKFKRMMKDTTDKLIAAE